MIKSTELLTVEIINDKITHIQVHPVCRHCGKDLIDNKVALPPLPDGVIDRTVMGFLCPDDKKMMIITVTDVENELKKLENML